MSDQPTPSTLTPEERLRLAKTRYEESLRLHKERQDRIAIARYKNRIGGAK